MLTHCTIHAVLATPFSLGTLAVLCGCGTPSYNRENTIGDLVELESITQGVPRGLAAPIPERPDKPSLRPGTLDRNHWSQRLVIVPIDGTTHRPTYATRVDEADLIPRQRGEFPTPASVIDTSIRSNATQQAFEGLVAPFHSAVDLAMIPVRMIDRGPFTKVTSPAEPPVRYNYPGGRGFMTQPGRRLPAMAPGVDAAPASAPQGLLPGESTNTPTSAPATSPPPPRTPAAPRPEPEEPAGVWIYRDGKWVKVPASEVTPR